MNPEDLFVVAATRGVVGELEDVGVPTRWAPIVGLGVAMVLSGLMAGSLDHWQSIVTSGLMDGLGAFGFYKAGETVAGGVAAAKALVAPAAS